MPQNKFEPQQAAKLLPAPSLLGSGRARRWRASSCPRRQTPTGCCAAWSSPRRHSATFRIEPGARGPAGSASTEQRSVPCAARRTLPGAWAQGSVARAVSAGRGGLSGGPECAGAHIAELSTEDIRNVLVAERQAHAAAAEQRQRAERAWSGQTLWRGGGEEEEVLLTVYNK